jgi:hypothetical protein
VRGERINWDSELVRSYGDGFTGAWVFVLDLGLRSGRDDFIELIMNMTEADQLALQPFVQRVTYR